MDAHALTHACMEEALSHTRMHAHANRLMLPKIVGRGGGVFFSAKRPPLRQFMYAYLIHAAAGVC